MNATQVIGTVGLIAALAAPAAAGQDPLVAAKDLYAAASYEEALATLTRLADGAAPDVARQIDQYRAFSLFALGRTEEAERVAESLIRANPLARLADGEASPRIESMFAAVRRRVLPGLIRDEYRAARAAIDSGNVEATEPRLVRVSRMLEEVRASGPIDDTLSDLSLLVDGFLDLSRATARQQAAREAAAATATPAVTAPAPAVTTAAGAAAARPPAPARADNSRTPTPASRAGIIYAGAGDSQLKPPVALSQPAPELPRTVAEVMKRTSQKSLVLELIIGETGEVEDVTVVESVVPVYDLLVVRTARQWKYRPATFDGVPVRFRKSVTIDFRDQ